MGLTEHLIDLLFAIRRNAWDVCRKYNVHEVLEQSVVHANCTAGAAKVIPRVAASRWATPLEPPAPS